MVFQYRAARGLGEVTWYVPSPDARSIIAPVVLRRCYVATRSDLRSAQEIEPSFRVSEVLAP